MSVLDKWLEKEFHKHPLFAIFCVVLAGSSAGVAFNPFVMAEDFATFQSEANGRLGSIESDLSCLQYSTDRNALNSELRAVNSEIFQLTRLVESGTATERDLERLDDLRTDKESLDLDLSTLVNGPHCAR